jgi:hypothetical protein
MKIKKKLIQNMRIREDRAANLRDKSFELSMKAGFIISESDIINFLLDKYTDKVILAKDELSTNDE